MRICYLLTGNPDSERAQSSKNVLEKVGFKVTFFKFIENKNNALSNKISMLKIYELILKGDAEWCYVFEDDINILEKITIDEIIEYEKISSNLFYLGVCMYEHYKVQYNSEKIRGHSVAIVKGQVRGAHAIAFSKKGVEEILKFSENVNTDHSDVLLEQYTNISPANVVRYDLESYIKGHRGIFFQDRNVFPSTI
jgi:hypothetical protein